MSLDIDKVNSRNGASLSEIFVLFNYKAKSAFYQLS